MVILLSTTLLIVFFAFIKNNDTNAEKENKIFFILTAVILIAVAGLRSRYTGTRDTEMYTAAFQSIPNFANFSDYFSSTLENGKFLIFSEPAFHLFCYLLSKISSNPQLLILTTSAINILSVLFFIKKNSKNTEVATIGYVCLGSFSFSMNGMRQALAMSICLLSYEFVKNKKFIPFCLTIILATLVHKTAFIFLIVYFVYNIKWNKVNTTLLLISLAAFVLFVNKIAAIFDELTDKNYSEGESFSRGGYVTILIYLLCIGLTLLKRNTLENDANIRASLVLSIFGFLLYSARFFSTQIYERVSYYFFYFVLILLASIVDESNNKNFMKLLVIFLSVLLFVYRLNGSVFEDYKFFFI